MSNNLKNALISVSDKSSLELLIPYLEQNNYNIYSTGGTMTTILELVKDENENKGRVISISDYTEYPEICNGRVKTLHPRIYGGILGIRSNEEHIADLSKINAKLFDLVVVNLYPFERILSIQKSSEQTLLENIDIGGHTLLRAAAKNYKDIAVLSDPAQYKDFINNKTDNKTLAKEAFKTVMQYDIAINNWFDNERDTVGVSYTKFETLKYGLNPYQKPSHIYTKNNLPVPFEILNGTPGYINLLDVHYAIHLVLEVKKQLGIDCCASYKHNSPAGVAMSNTQYTSYIMSALDIFLAARNIDPKSSFGDIIGFSGTVDYGMANILKNYVSDGIIAADYTEEALDVLKTKKKGAYLVMKQTDLSTDMEFRDLNGITLAQPTNDSLLAPEHDMFTSIPLNIKKSMILGYITLKYTQSNCICFVYKGNVIGIGSGQQNRVDCIRIAGEKARNWFVRSELDVNYINEIIMVSDAFLPFKDNVEVAAEYNVKYIVQPGGSIRDDEIFEACDRYNMVMVLTGQRVFTH